MKPVDKKDQPKLIAVCVLSALLFGWVIWSAIAPSGGAVPAGSQTPGDAAAKAHEAQHAANAKVAAASPDAVMSPPTSLGDVFSGKDPFVPNGIASLPAKPAPTSAPTFGQTPTLPQPQRPRIPRGRSEIALQEFLRTITPSEQSLEKIRNQRGIAQIFDPTGLPGSVLSPDAIPVVPKAPPAPVYSLSGVIIGDSSDPIGSPTIAILRGQKGQNGAEDRRFVKVGDDVGNGYYVASITRKSVVLRHQTYGSTAVPILMGTIGAQPRPAEPSAPKSVTPAPTPAAATTPGNTGGTGSSQSPVASN